MDPPSRYDDGSGDDDGDGDVGIFRRQQQQRPQHDMASFMRSHDPSGALSKTNSAHLNGTVAAKGGLIEDDDDDDDDEHDKQQQHVQYHEDTFDERGHFSHVAAPAAAAARYSSDETSSFSRSQSYGNNAVIDTRPNLKNYPSEDYSSNGGDGDGHYQDRAPYQQQQQLYQNQQRNHQIDPYPVESHPQYRTEHRYGAEASFSPDIIHDPHASPRNYSQSVLYQQHHDQQRKLRQQEQHFSQQQTQQKEYFEEEHQNYGQNLSRDYAHQEEEYYRQQVAGAQEFEQERLQQSNSSFQLPHAAAASRPAQPQQSAAAAIHNSNARPYPRPGVPQEPSGGVRVPAPPPTRLGRRCLTERPPRRPDQVKGRLEWDNGNQDRDIISIECAGCATILYVPKAAIMVECPHCEELHPIVTCRVVMRKQEMGIAATAAGAPSY